MVTLKTPDAPATSKQLWLLHILTKQDTRGLNLTMQEASSRIEELKSSGIQPDKQVIQTKSTPLFTTVDAEAIIAKRGDNARKTIYSNNKRHWGIDTFMKTDTSDLGKYGYCSKCFGDMQIFNSDNIIRHYNSHKYAKSLGLWGKR